jgi:hypothetical protein
LEIENKFVILQNATDRNKNVVNLAFFSNLCHSMAYPWRIFAEKTEKYG